MVMLVCKSPSSGAISPSAKSRYWVSGSVLICWPADDPGELADLAHVRLGPPDRFVGADGDARWGGTRGRKWE